MWNFGFKQIDTHNWLQVDKTTALFINPDYSDDYVRAVLAAKLSGNVPQDVQALFEIARGAMLYGYLFYPLYALAEGQLSRVAEAAIVHRSMQVGAPEVKRHKNGRESRMAFSDYIAWLISKGIFSRGDADHWHMIRSMRNCASHGTRQSILPPANAFAFLCNIAEDINELFDKIVTGETGVGH